MRTLALIVSMCAASSSWGSFRCIDEKGLAHFGDYPPAACDNATTYEVSSAGSVIRRIDPPTAMQGPGAAAEKASKRDGDRLSAEAKRRDRALLDSYSSTQEIDRARDRNLEMIKGRVDSANVRMRQLEQREKAMKAAIAGNGRAAPPPALQVELDGLRVEGASLAAQQARLNKDYEDTALRFEADKLRWLELRGNP